jgi:hypothetical protein
MIVKRNLMLIALNIFLCVLKNTVTSVQMYVFYWKINAFLRKTGKVLLIIMDIELILFGLKLRNPIYFLIESFSCGSDGVSLAFH